LTCKLLLPLQDGGLLHCIFYTHHPLTWERWRGGYFDPTRIYFSAVCIFLGII